MAALLFFLSSSIGLLHRPGSVVLRKRYFSFFTCSSVDCGTQESEAWKIAGLGNQMINKWMMGWPSMMRD